MAGLEGIEPSPRGLEALVLPLHHRPRLGPIEGLAQRLDGTWLRHSPLPEPRFADALRVRVADGTAVAVALLSIIQFLHFCSHLIPSLKFFPSFPYKGFLWT